MCSVTRLPTAKFLYKMHSSRKIH